MARMTLIGALALLFSVMLVLGWPRARAQTLLPSFLHSPRDRMEDLTVTHRPTLFMAIFGLSLILALGVAAEQQAAKIPRRIGILTGSGPTDQRLRREAAFRQGLLERGYFEEQDIVIEYARAAGDFKRLEELGKELVSKGVDVIVATGTEAVLAAQQATSTIPIVMTHVGDPVQRGFVQSLARPNTNITGLSNVSDPLAGKLLELLTEVVPQLSRVAVLWNPPQQRAHKPQLELLDGMARARRIGLSPVEVNHSGDFERAFNEIRNMDPQPQALILLSSALHFMHSQQIANFVLTQRLPAISWERTYAENGLLMAYGPDDLEIFRRAAYYVDRLLKGDKPADIPVEQPTAFELVINLRTAQALGLSLPPSLLLLAKEVIR